MHISVSIFLFTSCPFQGMKKSLEKYLRLRRRGQTLVGNDGESFRTGRACVRACVLERGRQQIAGGWQEMTVRDTAVVWARRKFAVVRPLKPWEASADVFETHLHHAATRISGNYCVGSLSKELPGHVQRLTHAEGRNLAV